MEDQAGSGVRFARSPLHPTDQIQSHQASNPDSVQTQSLSPDLAMQLYTPETGPWSPRNELAATQTPTYAHTNAFHLDYI